MFTLQSKQGICETVKRIYDNVSLVGKETFKCPSHGDLKRVSLFQLPDLCMITYVWFRSQKFTIMISRNFRPEWVPRKVRPSRAVAVGWPWPGSHSPVALLRGHTHSPEPHAGLGCMFTLLRWLHGNLPFQPLVKSERTSKHRRFLLVLHLGHHVHLGANPQPQGGQPCSRGVVNAVFLGGLLRLPDGLVPLRQEPFLIVRLSRVPKVGLRILSFQVTASVRRSLSCRLPGSVRSSPSKAFRRPSRSGVLQRAQVTLGPCLLKAVRT